MNPAGPGTAGGTNGSNGTPRPPTVLVVEDEEEIRRLAVRALERAGYVVLSSGWPEEALEIAKSGEGPIDALVTDVVMPTMSGISLATRIRHTWPGLPILFMSGYGVDAVAHATNFLAKPFLPSELVAAVDGLLQRTVLGEAITE